MPNKYLEKIAETRDNALLGSGAAGGLASAGAWHGISRAKDSVPKQLSLFPEKHTKLKGRAGMLATAVAGGLLAAGGANHALPRKKREIPEV